MVEQVIPDAGKLVELADVLAGHFDYEDYEEGCYECGGEGFVSDCVEEWACVDPEYGCDYCTRRCPLCNPARAASSDTAKSEGEV